MKIDRLAIQDLAKALSRPIGTLLALAPNNDPFYLGEARMRGAEWFAALYHEHQFGRGVHLRRIHYRLISQETPVLRPTAEPYENTEECWAALCLASKDARYAGLVSIGDFVDRRSPAPTLRLADTPQASSVEIIDGSLSSFCELTLAAAESNEFPPLTVSGGYAWSEPAFPALGRLQANDPVQPYHVELWAEKTTILDVLDDIALRRKLNVIYGLGELSLTACHQLISRIQANGGRPVRILYLSDFDPAGQSMPVAIARKIEWLVRQYEPAVDIQVRPILLTYEQCVAYRLPRTPIKESERRATNFEARFGEGATELDALEALHPGELRRIVEREIDRYYVDEEVLAGLADDLAENTNAELAEATEAVHSTHADEIDSITAEFDAVAERASTYRNQAVEAIAPIVDEYDALRQQHDALVAATQALVRQAEREIEPIAAQYQRDVMERARRLCEGAEAVFATISNALRARGEEILETMEPVEADGNEDVNPLFDSRRSYAEQIDRYKAFQGKATARKTRARRRSPS